MKKQLLVLIPSIFLVSGCSCSKKPEKPTDCQHVDADNNHFCDLCDKQISLCVDANNDFYCDICGQATNVPDSNVTCDQEDDVCIAESAVDSTSPDPKYPFYLKVGDKKVIDANTKSTQIVEQKAFTFSNNSQDLVSFEPDLSANGNHDKGTVTAIAVGYPNKEATIVATNNYSPALKSYFHIRTIDYVPEDTYLWQYGGTDDAKQFGYDYHNNKPGRAHGEIGSNNYPAAKLGDIQWNFVRSEANSLGSANGGLSFGKSEHPENITLTTPNTRKVRSITVEHGSAKGLATLTVSVGSKVFSPVASPRAESLTSRLTLSKFDVEGVSGAITLSFNTPAYDYDKAVSDESYMVPGATYLKSIWIEYDVEEISGIEIAPESQHKIVYESWDKFKVSDLKDKLIVNRITESGKYPTNFDSLVITGPEVIEGNELERKVNVSLTYGQNTFTTSYSIYLVDHIELDPEHSVPDQLNYVELSSFKSAGLVVWGVSKNGLRSDLTKSSIMHWSAPFGEGEVKTNDEPLQVGQTKVFGFLGGIPEAGHVEVNLGTIHPIVRIELKQTKIKELALYEGDSYSTSKANVVVNGYAADEKMDPVTIQGKMDWYDGVNFDKGVKTKKLEPGTTYVYGVFREYEPIRIDGITVTGYTKLYTTGTLEKTVYGVGEKFSYTGLTVYKNTEDDSHEVKVGGTTASWITDDSINTANPTNVITAQTKGIYCVYGNLKTAIIPITALPFTGLVVEGDPKKTIFFAGDTFDDTGLTVYKVTANGEIKAKLTKSNGVSFVTNDSLGGAAETNVVTTATTCIYAKYENLLSSPINVDVCDIRALGVDTTELEHTKYVEYGVFDPTGIKIIGYSDVDKTQSFDATKFVTMTWYDGKSVEENPEDTTKWDKHIDIASTKVVGYEKTLKLMVEVDIEVFEVTRIEFGEESDLTTKIYGDQEKISVTGLAVYGYSDTEPSAVAAKIPNENSKFYDGPFYDKGTKKSDKVMFEGSTYVYVELKNHAEVDLLKLEGLEVYDFTDLVVEGEMTKTAFYDGDVFDYTGLTVNLIIGENAAVRDVTDKIVWNEGENLTAGQTSVVGTYETANKKSFTITQEIAPVISETINIQMVKLLSELEEGLNCLLASKANKVYLDASKTATEMKDDRGVVSCEALDTEDPTITLSKAVENKMIKVSKAKSGTGYNISTLAEKPAYFGITESGNVSISASASNKNFQISFDAYGNLTIEGQYKDKSGTYHTKYLGYGVVKAATKTAPEKYGFGLFDENPANIQFYKQVA